MIEAPQSPHRRLRRWGRCRVDHEQLAATRVLDAVHPDDVYTGDEWVGRTVRRAHDDALDWIEANRQP